VVKKILPEYGICRTRGVFCRLYGNSVRPKSQGLCGTNFAPQKTKKKGLRKDHCTCGTQVENSTKILYNIFTYLRCVFNPANEVM